MHRISGCEGTHVVGERNVYEIVNEPFPRGSGRFFLIKSRDPVDGQEYCTMDQYSTLNENNEIIWPENIRRSKELLTKAQLLRADYTNSRDSWTRGKIKKVMRKAADLVRKSLKEWPENTDALYFQRQTFGNPNLDRIDDDYLQELQTMAGDYLRGLMGPYFLQNPYFAGSFWHLIETRPFMRILTNRAELAAKNKNYNLAADLCIQYIGLNPHDNGSMRQQLCTWLIFLRRYEDAIHFTWCWMTSKGEDYAREGWESIDFEAFEKPSLDIAFDSHPFESAYSVHIIFSLALALFKLYGNCLTARTVLRLGHKINGFVIKRILKKKTPFNDFNYTVTDKSSRASAEDYMYAAWDLWKTKKVQNWVQKVSRKWRGRICDNCGKQEKDFGGHQLCAGCEMAWYCNRSCQKKHWKKHKENCVKDQRSKVFKKTCPAMPQ